MIEREAIPELPEHELAQLHEKAKASFALSELVDKGRPYVEAYAAATPGHPPLEQLDRESVEVTMMMAGIFSNADWYNRYNQWVEPVRQAARQRFAYQPLHEQRAYAIGKHLQGAIDHPQVETNLNRIFDAIGEECYDEDYGWPALILHRCLKDSVT